MAPTSKDFYVQGFRAWKVRKLSRKQIKRIFTFNVILWSSWKLWNSDSEWLFSFQLCHSKGFVIEMTMIHKQLMHTLMWNAILLSTKLCRCSSLIKTTRHVWMLQKRCLSWKFFWSLECRSREALFRSANAQRASNEKRKFAFPLSTALEERQLNFSWLWKQVKLGKRFPEKSWGKVLARFLFFKTYNS